MKIPIFVTIDNMKIFNSILQCMCLCVCTDIMTKRKNLKEPNSFVQIMLQNAQDRQNVKMIIEVKVILNYNMLVRILMTQTEWECSESREHGILIVRNCPCPGFDIKVKKWK